MYGVRLWADLGTDRMTWREFGVLLRQLGDQSRFRVAVTEGVSSWTVTDHLLALLVDVAQIANWQRGANPKRPSKPPNPIPRPRELVEQRRERGAKRDRWTEFKQRARERAERLRRR